MRKIMRLNKVCDATDLSPSTINRQEAKGEFPKRIRLSSNAVGWYSDEIVGWIESRPRGGIDAPTKANDARRKSKPETPTKTAQAARTPKSSKTRRSKSGSDNEPSEEAA